MSTLAGFPSYTVHPGRRPLLRRPSRPQFTERSVAVFAREGDRTDEERKPFECITTTIPHELIAKLAEDFGIRVLPSANAAEPDW